MDENITSAMSNTTINDLIVVDDWLKVFDMLVKDKKIDLQKLYEETIEKLNNLSVEDYRETLTRFFVTIGYSKIRIVKEQYSESFDIMGQGQSGNKDIYLYCKVILDEIITREKLKQIITDISLAKKHNTFITTLGKFEEGCEEIAKNHATLIDVKKLASYMVNLQLVQSNTTQPG